MCSHEKWPSRYEMSLRCLKQISIERDISKTSQKHLKRGVFFETSLRCLKYISKRCLFWDVFKTSPTHLKITSQIHLMKTVFQMTSLRRLKDISKEMFILWRLWYVPKIYLESICDYSKISRKNSFVLIKSMCGR